MKVKSLWLCALLMTVSTASFSQFFKSLENSASNALNGNGGGSFTQDEAGRAIKEALTNGITHGVNTVSVTDGYFKNDAIKIPFPQDAQRVEDALRGMGLGSQIDQAVLSFNRAAESAAGKALPIFVDAITKMSMNDAVGMVNTKQQDACTQYLQRTTTDQLVAAFKPSIKDALDKVNATKYWADIITQYNKIPFVQKVNTDLPYYVTRKAITGLFFMIAKEEAKVRTDVNARTSDLLKKVFGNAKF
jgi:Protein of unknown function (DUF4197)